MHDLFGNPIRQMNLSSQPQTTSKPNKDYKATATLNLRGRVALGPGFLHRGDFGG